MLRKQMSIAVETNEELARQKESLENKASRMAQSFAGTWLRFLLSQQVGKPVCQSKSF